jgi:hypothetical protein
MSNHLGILSRAQLVRGERRSRSIIYRATLATLTQALTYLVEDCCEGRPEICTPLISGLTPCCVPENKRHA